MYAVIDDANENYAYVSIDLTGHYSLVMQGNVDYDPEIPREEATGFFGADSEVSLDGWVFHEIQHWRNGEWMRCNADPAVIAAGVSLFMTLWAVSKDFREEVEQGVLEKIEEIRDEV